MAQPNTLDIFPQGDVVLVCGDKENAKLRLRVSSTFLKQASPVFKAMLGPHFKEGRNLATSSKIELPLPEDDPQAMEIVCLIIHLCIDPVPADLGHKTFLKITTHCDKYGLLDVARPNVQQWLDLRSESPPYPISVAVDLMEAAFLLKCWKQVAKLGVLLVKHSTQDLVLLFPQRRIPVHLFYQLEKHRIEQQQRMIKVIEDEISSLAETRHNDDPDLPPCQAVSALTCHLLDELTRASFWPSSSWVQNVSLANFGMCVALTDLEDFEGASKCCDHCPLPHVKSASHACACIRVKIAEILQQLPSEVRFDPRKKDGVVVGFI